MSVAIKSTAQSASNIAFQAVSSGVKTLGRVFEYMGTALIGAAKKIAEWAKIFLKNLPVYYQLAKDYANFGIKYIRENKNSVAVGSVIGIAFAALIYKIASLFNNSEDF